MIMSVGELNQAHDGEMLGIWTVTAGGWHLVQETVTVSFSLGQVTLTSDDLYLEHQVFH